MGKIEARELTVSQVYNIVSFYVDEIKAQKEGKDSILNHFSNLLNWKLRRNIDILQPTAQSFEEYRVKIRDQFLAEWSTPEKSYVDGDIRKIKDEYLGAFTTAQDEANEKIAEVLNDKAKYEINVLDIESEIENIINELADADIGKIDLLMFMNSND